MNMKEYGIKYLVDTLKLSAESAESTVMALADQNFVVKNTLHVDVEKMQPRLVAQYESKLVEVTILGGEL